MTEEQKLLKETLDMIETLLDDGVLECTGLHYKVKFEELTDKIDALLTPKRKLNP